MPMFQGLRRRFKDIKPAEISSFLATLGGATAGNIQQTRNAMIAQEAAQGKLSALFERRLDEAEPGIAAVLPRGLAPERRLSIEDARRRAEEQTFGQGIAREQTDISRERVEDLGGYYKDIAETRKKGEARAGRAEPSATALDKIRTETARTQARIAELKLQKELQPEEEEASGMFRSPEEAKGFASAFETSLKDGFTLEEAGEHAKYYLRLIRGEVMDDGGGGDNDGEPDEYVFEGDVLKGVKAEGGGVTGEGNAALARQGLYNVAATVGTHFPLTGIPAEIGGALEVVKQRRGRLLYKVTPPVGTVGVQDNLIRLTLEEAEAYRQRNWTIEEAEERRMKTKPSPTYEVRR